MKKALYIILAIICFASPFFSWVPSIVNGIAFSANCGDYLELSADATNIKIAEKHLTKAIEYLEENNLTSGYTKIFVYYPKNDIGLWYENLKETQTELRAMLEKEEITELEESNMLMKLRETTLDNEGYVTHPDGISLHPNYTVMFWLNMTLWLLWILGGIFCYLAWDCYW
jgi:hypothetical protein